MNIHSVVYRNGFVDELHVKSFHLSVFHLLETQPVRVVYATSYELFYVTDLFSRCKSLKRVRLTTMDDIHADNYIFGKLSKLGLDVEYELINGD